MSTTLLIPRQCSALTKKGLRCRLQALPGREKCKRHATPSPSDAPSMLGSVGKVALIEFGKQLLKVGIEVAVEHFFGLQSTGRFAKPLPKEATLETLGAWYEQLTPAEQQTVLSELEYLEKQKQKKGTLMTGNAGAAFYRE